MRRLFIDIETSPNQGFFWGTGPKVFIGTDNIIVERAIICVSWKWQGSDEVHNLTWDGRQNDKALCREIAKIVREADEVIHHNGIRFDLPWLRTRSLFHKLPTFPDVKSVDTLRIAWSKFRFNNAKLDYLAKFLGVGAKTATGFGLWKKVVLENDREALASMVAYCDNDVRMLEKVYDRLVSSVRPATHAGVFDGKPVWSCPHCGSTNVRKSKTRVNPTGSLQHQMRCNDCGEYYTINNAAFKRYEKEKKSYVSR